MEITRRSCSRSVRPRRSCPWILRIGRWPASRGRTIRTAPAADPGFLAWPVRSLPHPLRTFWQEPESVVDPVDRFCGHILGPRRPDGQHTFQFGWVREELVDPGFDRGHEFHDGLGGVLLQIAVAVSGVALYQGVDVDPGNRGLDAQQIRHTGFGVRVVPDLAFAVCYRGANLLGGQPRSVEETDQPG